MKSKVRQAKFRKVRRANLRKLRAKKYCMARACMVIVCELGLKHVVHRDNRLLFLSISGTPTNDAAAKQWILVCPQAGVLVCELLLLLLLLLLFCLLLSFMNLHLRARMRLELTARISSESMSTFDSSYEFQEEVWPQVQLWFKIQPSQDIYLNSDVYFVLCSLGCNLLLLQKQNMEWMQYQNNFQFRFKYGKLRVISNDQAQANLNARIANTLQQVKRFQNTMQGLQHHSR